MLNVDPHEEILEQLMQGQRYADAREVANLIEGEQHTAALRPAPPL